MAWPVGLRSDPLFSRAVDYELWGTVPHNFPPVPSSERPQEAAATAAPLFCV
jgi:hypothetical protein